MTQDPIRKPYDPQVEALLAANGGRGPGDGAAQGPDVGRVEDLVVEYEEASVPVRLYAPAAASPPYPVVVWLHGGGFSGGGIEGADGLSRLICNGAECIVINVGYRLAPQNPFPAAVHDAYAVARWVHEKGSESGIDPTRIAVAGTSAGGNIALSVALMARDEATPPLVFVDSVYPVADWTFSTESDLEFAYLRAGRPTGSRVTYFKDDVGWDDQYASILNAADLSGFPPTFVQSAEIDVLRDHGKEVVRRLNEAGVNASWKLYTGVPHMFYQWWHAIDRAREAVDDTCAALREVFERARIKSPVS